MRIVSLLEINPSIIYVETDKREWLSFHEENIFRREPWIELGFYESSLCTNYNYFARQNAIQ